MAGSGRTTTSAATAARSSCPTAARAASPAASAVPTTRGPTRSRASSAPRRSSRNPTGSRGASCRSIRWASTRWGGFVFVQLTPDEAEARGTRCGAARRRAGAAPPLSARRAARRRGGSPTRSQANWKVMLENYNECYHCGPVHPELCRLVPAFKQRGGSELDWERGIPHRDGAWTFTAERHHQPAAVRGARRGRADPPQGRAGLSQLAAEPDAPSTWRRSWSFRTGPDRTTIVNEFLFHPPRWRSRTSTRRTRSSSGTW